MSTQNSQALIDLDPTQMNGAAGVAAAQSAQLMAALGLLNDQFKKNQLALLNLSIVATVAQADANKAKGVAMAIGAGVSAGIGVLGMGAAIHDFASEGAEKTLTKDLAAMDKKLRANATETAAAKGVMGTIKRDDETPEAAAQRAQGARVSLDKLKTQKETLISEKEDVSRKGNTAVDKERKLKDARMVLIQSLPRAVEMGAQAKGAGLDAAATKDQAMTSLTNSAEQSLDQARKDLNQTAMSFNQIKFFAASLAASAA